MSTTAIPEIGSVWVGKLHAHEAIVIWADKKTVVYDFSICAGSTRRFGACTDIFYLSYSPKPRTITVSDVELPEPMREALKDGDMYWFTCITEQGGVYETSWDGDPFDQLNLKRGNVFRTKEDAQAWFEFEVKQRRGEL